MSEALGTEHTLETQLQAKEQSLERPQSLREFRQGVFYQQETTDWASQGLPRQSVQIPWHRENQTQS